MKQISIFIENKKGKLACVTSLLSEHGFNLRALSIADTAEYGILRIVADEPEQAEKLLTENGYLTKINEVIGVKIEDKAGSLNRIVTALSDADVSVEYTYAFTSVEPGYAIMVLRVNDNAHALAALEKAGISAKL